MRSTDEIVNVTGGILSCPCTSLIHRYQIDSREVNKGDLFFALNGEKVNGHTFLENVARRGAVAAVVNEDYSGEHFGLSLIKVPCPLTALQTLARSVVRKMSCRIVGITGSIGKTTTKTFLATLLQNKLRLMVTPGNQNSQVGLPLAILNEVKGDEELLILEMGMSKKGELANLVELFPPDIALITHIDTVHIANFSSLEEIILEKSEILKNPRTKIGIFPENIKGKKIFSETGSCVKQKFCPTSAEGNILEKESGIPFKQKHILQNLAGALAVARSLGYSYEELLPECSRLELPERRGARIEKNGVIFLNDSYNACPDSMKAAMDSLPGPEGDGRRIAVLGEMLELGKLSEACHYIVGEYSINFIDIAFCIGEGSRTIVQCRKEAGKAAEFFPNLEHLAAKLKDFLLPGDVVLLKGSKAVGLWKLIEMVEL